jgi:hypothetical protein
LPDWEPIVAGPDAVCHDCEATEDDTGGPLYEEILGVPLCSNCRMMRRPGGY